MTDQDQEPFFKQLDGNTLFTAAYSWIAEDDKAGTRELRTAIGTWAWEDVGSIHTMDDNDFEELEHPRCAVMMYGGPMHLRAEYQTVLRAWRRYRLAYGAKHIRFTTEN